MNMDQIQHKFIHVNGLNLHVAEAGAGDQVVLFLHGFPEIWYSWRHQMIALAGAGFRTIAPDYRGYGLSDSPPRPEEASYADILSDLLGILDSLAVPKVNLVSLRSTRPEFGSISVVYSLSFALLAQLGQVVLVGKDFGARPAYLFALLHPERVLGVVTMGVPYIPPAPSQYHKYLPEGFYISRWQEPGRAEADFGRFDAKTVVRNIYIMFSRSEIPIAAEDQEVMDIVGPATPLPRWFTEEDLAAYGALYEKSGFQTALKIPYRSLNEQFNLSETKVKLPALLIMGEKDYVIKFPGMEEFVRSGKAKDYVPDLEIIYLPEGCHFVQEQLPDEVNQLLLTFLNSRITW